MAPALVKHCAAKERNSIGKKIFNLDCLSDIVYKRSLVKQSVFQKELLMESNSELFSRIDRQLNNEMPSQTAPEKLEILKSPPPFLCVAECNKIKNNSEFEPLNHGKNHINCVKHDVNQSLTVTEKCSQRKNVENIVINKKVAVEKKLFSVDTDLGRLNRRLWSFQARSFTAKIAANSLPKSSIIQDDLIDVESARKSVICSDASALTKHIHSPPNGILKSLSGGIDFKTLNQKLFQGFDALTVCREEPLSEFEYESKVKVTPKHRRKSDDHPPTSVELRRWKEKRVEVGSKCSWLGINIAELDKKIERVNNFQNNLKKKRGSLLLPKTLPTSTQSDVNSSQNTEGSGDCARVHPIATPLHRHTYLTLKKKNETLSSEKKSDKRDIFSSQLLDKSHHPVLSFRNETSLSLLLEETLRNEHINTKVTITKSTKKKKKPKLNSAGSVVSSASHPKSNPALSTLSRTRNRFSGVSEGDGGRKRHHPTSTGSTMRTRKVRKLSDSVSCDSPKPLTPTHEMASPSTLTQNLKSHGFFPAISQKKKTTSGDFDINNIVIPYSMASSTRLERIQYKEIPTPGWRSIWNEESLANGIDDWECTDDELYLERHDRCEMQEQKRFTNYFTAPPNRRQRQNRSSECGFSEPASPLVIEDLKSATTTPADSPGGVTGKSSKLAARLATVTPILEEERGPSWTHRRFPLSETEFKKLDPVPVPSPIPIPVTTEVMDTALEVTTPGVNTLSVATHKNPTLDLAIGKKSDSLMETENLLLNEVDDEKNWTVKLLNDSMKVNTINNSLSQAEKQRKGIVLKLAKK